MNHWVSAKGPKDVCMACGEPVHNIHEQAPVLITGDCKGAAPISSTSDGSELALAVCRRCADKPPYLGHSDLAIEIPLGRPGWCALCHRFMGESYVVVPARPPAQDLVQAFVDAAAAMVTR
jgi:hypothetical protein